MASMKCTTKPVMGEGGLFQGRWTQKEHTEFLVGLYLHGREWKKVAKRIRSRTSAQVRSHAQKFFAKLSKTESEQNQLAAAAAAQAAAAAGITTPGYFQNQRQTSSPPRSRDTPRRPRAESRARTGQSTPPVLLPADRVTNVLQGLVNRRARVLRQLWASQQEPDSELAMENMRSEVADLEQQIAELYEVAHTNAQQPSIQVPAATSASAVQRHYMAQSVSPRSRRVLQSLDDDEIQALEVLAAACPPPASEWAHAAATLESSSEEDLEPPLKKPKIASTSGDYVYY